MVACCHGRRGLSLLTSSVSLTHRIGWGQVSTCVSRLSSVSTPRVQSVEETTTPDSPTSEGAEQPSNLPLAQLCKNLLMSNWRGQLSTIKADSDKKDANSVQGSVVSYALIDGTPLVWLRKGDPHLVNLLLDDRGSLLVGHTDPPPLISAFRAANKVPPRVILLGGLVAVEASEMSYLTRKVEKRAAAVQSALTRAGPAVRSLLEAAGPSAEDFVTELQKFRGVGGEEGGAAYRMYARSCHYVDVLEGRHSIPVADVAGAATDPLAVVHGALMEGMNQSNGKRRALILFCAAFLQVEVHDAYLFSADRWGFNILAQPKGDGKKGPWREFRFAFSKELRDADDFCAVLEEMERDVMANLSAKKL